MPNIMSPTAATVRRSCDMSGCGSGSGSGIATSGGGDGGGSAGGAGGGVVAQAASHTAASSSAKFLQRVCALVAKANSQHVYPGGAQTTTQQVELIKIVSGSDAHPVIGLVVDRDFLNRRFYAL